MANQLRLVRSILPKGNPASFEGRTPRCRECAVACIASSVRLLRAELAFDLGFEVIGQCLAEYVEVTGRAGVAAGAGFDLLECTEELVVALHETGQAAFT